PAASRPLPSFPTRRSSDLAYSEPVAFGPLLRARHIVLRPYDRVADLVERRHLVHVHVRAEPHGFGLRGVVGRVDDEQRLGVPFPDRKSTRLNSSHLVISYA